MKNIKETINRGKPFIKWVGGKGQLLKQIDNLLPHNFHSWNEVTYIEPFVGGGAMLFYMLQRYPNIKRAVINDINYDLVLCYRTIKHQPDALITSLKEIEREYLALSHELHRKEYYLNIRAEYNQKECEPIRNTTLFLFLNRTCFNGLYRVNKSGGFNVPFGKYERPTICDEATIKADNLLLQNVEILHGDFGKTIDYATDSTLFYFDPPYRPLTVTSSFNDYTKEAFNDESQRRLKTFCDLLDRRGHTFLLSNSDSKDDGGSFFDKLYDGYKIERVKASRSINADPTKRGKLNEIVIRNYTHTKKENQATQQEFKIAMLETERI